MKNFKNIILLPIALLLMVVWSGCHPRMVPTITAGEYNEQRNQTDYIVLPYGSVSLPGKWVHGRYHRESRQQYFSNFDSTTVSVAFGPCKSLGFPNNGATGYAFVKLYNEWETKYEAEVLKQNVKVIEADSANKYIISQVTSNNVNQINLCGAMDCNCGECAFQMFTIVSHKLTDEQKVKLLRDIYLGKK